jgi:hypothetical protein
MEATARPGRIFRCRLAGLACWPLFGRFTWSRRFCRKKETHFVHDQLWIIDQSSLHRANGHSVGRRKMAIDLIQGCTRFHTPPFN